jgi:beta-galactosidase/beta-glucuronidase
LELTGKELKDWPLWTPEAPLGIKCEIVLRDDESGAILDRHVRTVYRRNATAVGGEIHLNGQPITVRGVLNWGYAPPRLCPSRDREWMKKELEFIKARGFNTMKFCLWIPPQDYLDLCDEMGILAWLEYPTWHPKLTSQFLPQLLQEYEEFFQFDRNHPSVILRSLTCETGHSAELDVIRQLYDKAHQMIPGSLVEDDSSWISWQRVHDFYDDHP